MFGLSDAFVMPDSIRIVGNGIRGDVLRGA